MKFSSFEKAQRALNFVMDFGAMLDEKEEWDLDDNFNTTEALHDLYQRLESKG